MSICVHLWLYSAASGFGFLSSFVIRPSDFASAVAHAAISQLPGVDMIAAHQQRTRSELVGRLLPRHVEDLILWSDEPLGVPMALQAPFHVECVFLPH